MTNGTSITVAHPKTFPSANVFLSAENTFYGKFKATKGINLLKKIFVPEIYKFRESLKNEGVSYTLCNTFDTLPPSIAFKVSFRVMGVNFALKAISSCLGYEKTLELLVQAIQSDSKFHKFVSSLRKNSESDIILMKNQDIAVRIIDRAIDRAVLTRKISL